VKMPHRIYRKRKFVQVAGEHIGRRQKIMKVPDELVKNRDSPTETPAQRKQDRDKLMRRCISWRAEKKHIGAYGYTSIRSTDRDENHTYRQKGRILFWDKKGTRLTYDTHSLVGMLTTGLPHFYLVSVPDADLDPLDHKGKLKLGMTSGARESENANAHRLTNYRRHYGDAVFLHVLILFNSPQNAFHFETMVKKHLRHIAENSGNVRGGRALTTKSPKPHEWYSLKSLPEVMLGIEAVRVECKDTIWRRGFKKKQTRSNGILTNEEEIEEDRAEIEYTKKGNERSAALEKRLQSKKNGLATRSMSTR
jgi:hypothetical protein